MAAESRMHEVSRIDADTVATYRVQYNVSEVTRVANAPTRVTDREPITITAGALCG